MDKVPKIVAFEGGVLRELSGVGNGREAVLGVSLSQLLVKVVRVPAGEEPCAFCEPILKAMSPFPDETLTVSCETVRETEAESVVIAAALPEGASDALGEALDAAKLNVVAIDALAFGQLRGIWNVLGESDGRRLVLIKGVDCISVFAIDGDQPCSVRALSEGGDLRRELMLSLLEAEDFGGAKPLVEIVLVGDVPAEGLDALAPVRKIEIGEDAGLVGVQARAAEEGSLNALPASWREVLEETRFKAKLTRNLAIAGAIWALVMGILFGVPIVYGYMTDYQKGLSRQHGKKYRLVSEMKRKIELVKKYSDHSRGALEIMKAVSDRLPDDIELSRWSYRRDDGVTVRGDAVSDEAVYAFKDAMEALSAGEDEDAERVFADVTLQGPRASRNGRSFDLSCSYKGAEDAQ